MTCNALQSEGGAIYIVGESEIMDFAAGRVSVEKYKGPSSLTDVTIDGASAPEVRGQRRIPHPTDKTTHSS